jgi:hypothetical protein
MDNAISELVTATIRAFTQDILPLLIGVVALWITSVLVPMVKRQMQLRLSFDQRALLVQVAAMAVLAAEQLYAANKSTIDDLAKAKRDYAFKLIYQWFHERGIEVSVDEIYQAIEASVMDQFNRDRNAAIGTANAPPSTS